MEQSKTKEQILAEVTNSSIEYLSKNIDDISSLEALEAMQTYSDQESEIKVKKALALNSEWNRVEDVLPENEFWYRVQVDRKHHILPHCYMGGSWWCYGSSCPDESKVTHWQDFVDVSDLNAPTPTKIQLLTIIEERDKRIKDLEELIAVIK